MIIPVVENPRRRRSRKRRHLSAAQKAAGFGGKSAMSGRKSRRRSRRRNPALASVFNPRRRRRSASSVRRVVRRRRRNPGLLGGLGGFDLGAAMYVGVGALVPKYVLSFVANKFPMVPTTGPVGYLTRAAAVWVTAFGVKKVLKSQKAYGYILAGGLGMIFVDLFQDYVAPRIPGLAGLGYYTNSGGAEMVSDGRLSGVGYYSRGSGAIDPTLYG